MSPWSERDAEGNPAIRWEQEADEGTALPMVWKSGPVPVRAANDHSTRRFGTGLIEASAAVLRGPIPRAPLRVLVGDAAVDSAEPAAGPILLDVGELLAPPSRRVVIRLVAPEGRPAPAGTLTVDTVKHEPGVAYRSTSRELAVSGGLAVIDVPDAEGGNRIDPVVWREVPAGEGALTIEVDAIPAGTGHGRVTIAEGVAQPRSAKPENVSRPLDDAAWLPAAETHEPAAAEAWGFDLAVQARMRRERAAEAPELVLGAKPMCVGARRAWSLGFVLLALLLLPGGFGLAGVSVGGNFVGGLVAAVVGCLVGLAASYCLLASFHPTLALLADRDTFALGAAVEIRWTFSRPPRRTRGLTAVLHGEERATFRREKGDTTAAQTFFEETVHEEVAVAIGWELPAPPEELTLELVWATAGRGRTDSAAALRRVWRGGLDAAGAEVVAWRMPAGSLTRDGKLVSIGWVLRLRAKEQRKPAEVPIVLATPGPDA